MKVQGKVILVTGGGNGLGRELVLELLRRGAYVAAVDINEEGLGETAKLAALEGLLPEASGESESERRLSSHVVNITDKEAVDRLPEEVMAVHGQIDGVVNNAGIIQPFVAVNDLEFDTINKVMQVNFFGTLFMTKAFLPHLLERDEAHLVNVASMGGFFPVPGQTIYGSSKAAVKLLTEGLYTELLDTNVAVTLVLPGGMSTNITKNSGVKMNAKMEEMQKTSGNSVLSATKAAEIIINGMERGRYRILVGSDAKVMSFLYRLFPGLAPRLFSKFMKDKLMG